MSNQAQPSATAALFQEGLALHRSGQVGKAEAAYREILAGEPKHADALHLLGVIHQQRGEYGRAAELIGLSIAENPRKAAPHSNRGIALHHLGQFEEALASFERALSLKPDYLEALHNRGNTLRALKRHGEALACYDRVLQLAPGMLDAHLCRGDVLRELKQHSQALASFDRALQLDPTFTAAMICRGNALQALGRSEEALACCNRVLELRPDLHEVFNNRGSALRDLKRYSEAAEAFGRLAASRPQFDYVHSNQLHSQLYCCDWSNYDKSVQNIMSQVAAGRRADVPFSFLAISTSPAEQLQCAQAYVADRYPASSKPLWSGGSYQHEKIHLAYLSADFHEHATAYLMASLFETHDRERFHVTAVSFGPDADDRMRRRLVSAFDDFVDVRSRSDLDVALLMRELEIDIAVDLKGFTTGNRCGVLAHRAAPIQVNYLGYPGTMGADYIDYLIADARVIPTGHLPFYSEKIVHLPDSYQVNDRSRAISPLTPTRKEAGLPDQGFVFCCFNNNYKIAPGIFSRWMRLLKMVPGSVLWLFGDNADAMRNLRSEANRGGVEPSRIVFAPRVSLEDHLARHRLADLFLDTLPCNAHTTASDALWAGLPVLTCMGNTFAGRVAGSLLSAIGLPELVCENPDQYEAEAFRLATTPQALAELRKRLERNRLSSPLFDTERFRKHLEAAYIAMWKNQLQGKPPEGFAVADLP